MDKAKEIGVDWWVNHPAFSRHQQEQQLSDSQQLSESIFKLEERLARMESPTPVAAPAGCSPAP